VEQSPRLVFAMMARSLRLRYWVIEDVVAVDALRKRPRSFLPWSDDDMVVNSTQVLDTLRRIGVVR
jgi:hypothetical protein